MGTEKDVKFSNAVNGENSQERSQGNELVGHTVQKRNWKGIVIALVVIIIVCALIITTVILLTPRKSDEPPKPKFTFEDFIKKKFAPKSFSFKWVTDSDAIYYRNDDGAVIRYNCSTNSSAAIMGNSTFKELDTSTYMISPDENYVLLAYDVQAIYRHSTRAKYKVVNLHNRNESSLQGPNGTEFQYVSWSPTYDGLVFVQNNDVYYRRSMNLQDVDAFRVTDTGVMDQIFNGVPDWVYEEEILSEDHALWWSPTGSYFLFASFNDTLVRNYHLTYYGSMTDQYVTDKKLLYPKAGTTNPVFSLHVFHTHSNKTINIEPPEDLKNIDHYFTTVTWADSERVLITWMNRFQNMTLYTICHAQNGSCYENYRYLAPSGWCETPSAIVFKEDGSGYFTVLPLREGEAGYFRHVALVDAGNSVNIKSDNLGKRTFITSGQYDVIEIEKYDPKTALIYYLAYRAGDPTSRHVYKTSTREGDVNFLKPTCVSCTDPDTCDWVSASFSTKPDGEFYMLTCLGPSVPTYTMRSTATQSVISFEDNKEAADKLTTLALPRTKFLRIPLDNTNSMWAKLLLPEPLKEDEVIQYNMLTSVYGGPDSQKVSKAFSLGWEDYLASSHNIVIGYADPRGSSGRGDAWRHANYRHLGTTEVDDSIVAGRYFNSLKYIGDRTAIWGWSYGGYLTASVLGRGSEVFDCGMSVAPVTAWTYYDTVYTERYMGLPDENSEAYNYANVSRYAENFKKSTFMLVHGTGDDNVHFQNSAHLARALTEANVYFRSQFYIDQQHSINGGNSRTHLYNTLEDFLLNCFDGRSSRMDELNNPTVAKPTEKDVDNDE
ncbi:dipeptidyl peptidase 4-like isoform X2 [Dreissena polymorpha]|uniref:dipeptidyl peptidase 4-like isoform X2 n=1 Tax=Dreissena polymorpha TaxID=45954 RepID=UPI0022642ADB|nr:dipeptidyl peptidase 4-like isoform X2 [Dreissena polymorpha]